MAQFTVNSHRFDPYKNFKFRIKWDGKYVAGVNNVSALTKRSEPVTHREGGDPSTARLSPSTWSFEPITLQRGLTHDLEFEAWANLVYSTEGDAAKSLAGFRRDITIELLNEQGGPAKRYNVFRRWCLSTRRSQNWMRTGTPSPLNRSCCKTRGGNGMRH